MNPLTRACSERVSRRAFVSAAVCALIGCAVLSLTLTMRAQQSSGPRALVQHGFSINGRIEGSVQQLTSENTTLNGGATMTGDLLMPGTPSVQQNGHPSFGGVLQGSGNAQPSNHRVTLNGNAQLGRLITRTDPVAMPNVAAPPAAAGTRDVTLTSSSQSPGDFSTLHDLTLNGNAGAVAVPPGTYHRFTANGGSRFVLGVAGSTQPAVYNLNSLTLNGGSRLELVGPIVLTIATAVTLDNVMGAEAHPLWLNLKIASGGVTLNGGSALYAVVTAPTGAVTINGNATLAGNIACDRLTINGNGLLRLVQVDTTPPVVNVSQPTDGALVKEASVTVTGTFSDESATTVSVNNVAASVTGNSFSATVSLAEGSNTIRVTATDVFGNQSEPVTRAIVRDSTPPAITITEPAEQTHTTESQVTVTGTYSDLTSGTVTVNNTPATLTGNTFTAIVPLNEGSNTLNVVGVDALGNRTELARDITRDPARPVVVVANPAQDGITNGSQVLVTGTYQAASSITVNSVAAALDGSNFTASVPLDEGPNTLHVVAADALGHLTEVTQNIRRDSTVPVLTLTQPIEGTVGKSLTVAGTVTDTTTLTLVANGNVLPVAADGTFSVELSPTDGTAQVSVSAVDAAGNRTEVVRHVTIDTAAPVISSLSPAEGTIIDSTATVSGRILDATVTTVKVNGVNGDVDANGDFSVANIPVAEGDAQIEVIATDAVGNQGSGVLHLVGKDRTAPATPAIFPIISPTRLAYQTIEGRAEPGAEINIAGSAQPVTINAAFGTGLFAATVNLAPGANTLTVSATDASGNTSPPVSLAILSNLNLPLPPAGQPAQINISSGNTQRGLVGADLPRPLIAIVTDRTGAPVAGVTVKFKLMQGDGHFVGGGDEASVSSDEHGQASVRYLAGAVPGPQLVRADYAGNASSAAIFTVETYASNANAVTTVSGVVLDQNLRALPNVLVRIGGQQTRTGADGRFIVSNVATGPHQLIELIGRDQITLPGRWPNITYDCDILPGIDNDLGRPLFLPRVNDGVALPLDANNIVTQDVVFELPVVAGQPAIKVTARAGTHIIFPPDATDKRLSVTRIATNRVPMVLEDGRATNLYISVQPSGAVFEQPLEISFPNVDHRPANSEVLLMSFDHDAGRYIKVGTGHVSADGQNVVSDPGSGIRVGAWHALPPPEPKPEVTVLGNIQIKGNPAFKNQIILNAEAWVEGTRAVMTSAPNAEDRLDFRATYSLPSDDPVLSKMEATTITAPVGGEITSDAPPPDGTASSSAPSSAYPLLAKAGLPDGNVPAATSDAVMSGLNLPVTLQGTPPDISVYYGGSQDSTSDPLTFRVRFNPALAQLTPRKVVWSLTGPGADAYTPPDPGAAALVWEVGRVQPQAGILKVKAVVYYAAQKYGPPLTLENQVEVGIRTDDVAIIGWINPDGVPLSSAGVAPIILQFFPLEGMRNTSTAQKYLTLTYLGSIAAGNLSQPIPIFIGPMQNPIFIPLTVTDRIYILNWMFKHAANPCNENRCPPNSFQDDSWLYAFQIGHKTSYKMFNRFQIKYRVAGGEFKGIPTVEKRAAEIGVTVEPIFGEDAPGQAGPANDTFAIVNNAMTRLVNDGTPESVAVSAFNTLADPFVWNDIGSRIEFGTFGTSKRLATQVYPTYNVYDNLNKTQVLPQASHPIGNFTRTPSNPHVP